MPVSTQQQRGHTSCKLSSSTARQYHRERLITSRLVHAQLGFPTTSFILSRWRMSKGLGVDFKPT